MSEICCELEETRFQLIYTDVKIVKLYTCECCKLCLLVVIVLERDLIVQRLSVKPRMETKKCGERGRENSNG